MYMITFSSFASTCILLIFGKVPLSYAFWCAIPCSVGLILGQLTIGKAVKKYNKQSLVTTTFAIFMFVCFVSGAGSSIYDLYQLYMADIDVTKGGSIC